MRRNAMHSSIFYMYEKSNVIVVGREGVAPQGEVQMNGEILAVVSSFKCLGEPVRD